MCQRRYLWHQIVIICLLGFPVAVALTSTIVGYLTLTENGRVTPLLVPDVRLVVGSLQFAVAALAVVAVLLAALGLKPGGNRLLLMYTLLMVLLMVVQLSFTAVLVGLVYAPEQVPASTRAQLTESLHSPGIDVINRVQMDYQCCGVNGYKDWNGTTWSEDNPGALAPPSCCENHSLDNCTVNATNFYEAGCQSKITEAIDRSAFLVAVSTAPLLVIEGVAASLSGHLYRTLVRYSKYNVL